MVPKFLVVDDDAEARTLMSAMLESLGCESETAASGEESLKILKEPSKAGQFDAIFLDIMMPGMSGLDVLRELKLMPHTKELPILMLTCLGSSEDIVKGYQGGADYYIPKPFTKDQVVYGLDMVLGEQQQEEDGEEKKETPTHFLPEA
ncbi:MAG: hypothetical protein DCC75_02800 [Proteobacteria bacterium]|nr:MAG: hypothetical protein DCC75_02800 [Pseudomonadota bacterium]